MSSDAYWDMRDRHKEALQQVYWMVRDHSGTDLTAIKTHSTEDEAWAVVVKAPFTVADYKAKGYKAVRIDVAKIASELAALQKYA